MNVWWRRISAFFYCNMPSMGGNWQHFHERQNYVRNKRTVKLNEGSLLGPTGPNQDTGSAIVITSLNSIWRICLINSTWVQTQFDLIILKVKLVRIWPIRSKKQTIWNSIWLDSKSIIRSQINPNLMSNYYLLQQNLSNFKKKNHSSSGNRPPTGYGRVEHLHWKFFGDTYGHGG